MQKTQGLFAKQMPAMHFLTFVSVSATMLKNTCRIAYTGHIDIASHQVAMPITVFNSSSAYYAMSVELCVMIGA